MLNKGVQCDIGLLYQEIREGMVSKGVKTAVSEYCNSLNFHHDTEEMTFEV